MAEASIAIDKDAMQALVLKAILDSWSDEYRDKLVRDALAYLLNEKEDPRNWNSSTTVLQGIMRRAIAVAAEQVVRDLLQEKYQQTLVDAIDPHLAEIAEIININEALASAITAQMREKRGY